MTSLELLKRYEAMLQLSRQMLDAAKNAEWEKLVELEQVRSAVEEELKRNDTIRWQPAEAAKKAALIQSILDGDAEIKGLTESWMKELQGDIGSIGTEMKLKKAYGAL
ncbi:flagellar protein FliT [Noviherbaspirillum denitrificans]|uniref:Flagellar protein FliT n=1 Tax=Noviherbaspirillum denitrificans TaxID=1968433 RepID=A0A254TF65_9BURK|nr:flagellar protein FliT [Noviherbaspirillum denitrificans]OWW21299.1 hypothetical protein AYR66_19285 [Noviherbaspirillum denitrificans]